MAITWVVGVLVAIGLMGIAICFIFGTEACDLGVLIIAFTLIPAVAIALITQSPPGGNGWSHELPIENPSNTVLKVNYFQYNQWKANSIESQLLMPGQIKLFKNVKIISQHSIDVDFEGVK